MQTKILFIERKPSFAVSIEKVFRQVAENLTRKNFSFDFQSLEYPNNLFGTLMNLLFFSRLRADIYHVTGHVHYITLILPNKNTVLTIHDLGILYIRKGLRRFFLKKILFDLPLRKLKYITVVSEATKQDLLKHTDCDPKKIRVIENPLQKQFFLTQKKQFSQTCPVLLQIGTTLNKNLFRLIEAIENIKCHLVIIGEINSDVKDLLERKKISFCNKINLNNDEIKNEYANADIVTFCSTFEGFGLPIIEAQAMLTPVITSNRSPMKEVAGTGAALIEPEDSESIRNCILSVINNENYRTKLVKSGIENVKKYKPENIVPLYENLYQEILTDLKLV